MGIAQLVERLVVVPEVAGSSPVTHPKEKKTGAFLAPVFFVSLGNMVASTPHSPEPAGIRLAEDSDIDAVVATVTSAFLEDPLWSPIFSEVDDAAFTSSRLWHLYVSSAALRYPWTFVTPNVEAAAVWYPPGAEYLTTTEIDGFDSFLEGLVGRTRADEVQEIDAAFDAAHPAEPSFYLSLLATHNNHRGRGLGMDLLRQSLAHIDALEMPAYLESSNPANDARYTRAGFEPLGVATMPSGQRVTTMWRPARK